MHEQKQYFNSTLVWLIPGGVKMKYMGIYAFQFHIGMINPFFLFSFLRGAGIFQFHIGMINPSI